MEDESDQGQGRHHPRPVKHPGHDIRSGAGNAGAPGLGLRRGVKGSRSRSQAKPAERPPTNPIRGGERGGQVLCSSVSMPGTSAEHGQTVVLHEISVKG